MKSKEELEELINSIKTARKRLGNPITNDEIAKSINVSRGQLQKYLNGSHSIQYDTFELLYEAYSDILPKSPKTNSETELTNLAMLKVIYKEVAKLKSKIENKSISDCLDDLETETMLVIRELAQV